jgi:hypothetical protein
LRAWRVIWGWTSRMHSVLLSTRRYDDRTGVCCQQAPASDPTSSFPVSKA